MGEVISLQPRIAYPVEAKSYGVNEQTWRVLVESTFPSAKSAEGILLAVAYCQARKLDILQFGRPFRKSGLPPMTTRPV